MRPRTFILLILVLLVGAAAVVLIIARSSDGGLLAGILPGQGEATATPIVEEEPTGEEEPGIPVLPPTPSMQSVIVAKERLPVGARLRSDLLVVESRPSDNIALQGGYTFSEDEMGDLIGQIVQVDIAKGQAILEPMLASSPSNLASFGSDLALYVAQGKVAIAVPINRFSGAAYAMRPGDLVDVMMTLSLVKLEPQFRTPLPNQSQRVNEQAFAEGRPFLFDPTAEGRLEFIPELGITALIAPGSTTLEGQSGKAGSQIPRRVTQLTIQQAEVLWMGTWQDPRELAQTQEAAPVTEGEAPLPTPTPLPERPESKPDVVILSMSAQDALTLKLALEMGIDVDLVLRAQGDNTVYVTTSITLPQIVEQGSLIVPEVGDFSLEPPINKVPRPEVPPNPPGK